MQLLILILIAGVGGFFLARSRFSAPIDKAAGDVGDLGTSAAEKGRGWWQARFGKQPQVVDVSSRDADVSSQPPIEETRIPAEKKASRRKSDTGEQEEIL